MSSSRRSDPCSSDGFDAPGDLHAGLDRELDLAAERPWVAESTTSRGPGVLVASIVAGSLTLAGLIMLVRSQSEPDASASGSSRSSGEDTPASVAFADESTVDEVEATATAPTSTPAADTTQTHARASNPGRVALRTNEIPPAETSPRSRAVPAPAADTAEREPTTATETTDTTPSRTPSTTKPASTPSPVPATPSATTRPRSAAERHPVGEEPRLPGLRFEPPSVAGPPPPTLPDVDDPSPVEFEGDDDAPSRESEVDETEPERSPDEAERGSPDQDPGVTVERASPEIEPVPSTETPERGPAPATPAEAPDRPRGTAPPTVHDRVQPPADAEPPSA